MKPSPALKDQFAQAKALIQRKQYDQARALLRAIDYPTAGEWLAKLDGIAPEKPARSSQFPGRGQPAATNQCAYTSQSRVAVPQEL